MSSSSAARTNLTSAQVTLHKRQILGEGQFRIAYAGTYVGGNRNNQEAVCKCFKTRFRVIEEEFFAHDFEIADRAIRFAEEWNVWCPGGREILITRGTVHRFDDGVRYLVEPLIRYYTKFTSNNGYIDDSQGTDGEYMEAFSHYTYHRSGGSMIVCDLQGRHRDDSHFPNGKCRFELTDPAICSRQRQYGPTDMGEKGIESFFANHDCNEFCHRHGGRWQRPRAPERWFAPTSSTSMLGSSYTRQLGLGNRTRFNAQLAPIVDDDDSDDS